MSGNDATLVAVIGVALFFDFTNGFHDTANYVATWVGTRALSPRLAVLVSAAVHLYLWLDFARDDDVLGPSFMLNAVAGVVIAVLLLVWRHWVPAFLALGFGASTLLAFVLAPLRDVAPGWRHPVLGATVEDLLTGTAGQVLRVLGS